MFNVPTEGNNNSQKCKPLACYVPLMKFVYEILNHLDSCLQI